MDVSLDELLADLGYRTESARRAARAALEAAGLTNARKQRIAAPKLPLVKATLDQSCVLVCERASCRDAAVASAKTIVAVAQATDCSVCGGSENRAAIDRAVDALARRGWRRVVVVGGSPGTHHDLADLVGDRFELRLVDGTERRTSREAKADLAWADLVIIWGGTELDHKVSKLYTDARDPRVVVCARRGIAALASTAIDSTRRRSA